MDDHLSSSKCVPIAEGRIGRREFIRGLAFAGLAASVPLPEALERQEHGLNWSRLREEFLFEPGHIYFNNASLGSPPRAVVDSVGEGYRRLAANPTRAKIELSRMIEETVRPAAARLVGSDVEEIALSRCASEGLSMIANGIGLEPGDEVLTTTQEHPGGLMPWLDRAERSGIVVRQVPVPSPPSDREDIMKRIGAAFTGRTRVLAFCHVTRGGFLYPVRELCGLARSRGVVSAVDGAQAVGTMPVDLHAIGCDLYASSLHKWTLAPAGNGLLYVRRDFQPLFRPPGKPVGRVKTARDFEPPGTPAFPVRAAAGAALVFVEKIGMAEVERRCRMLSDRLKAGLKALPRVRLLSPSAAEVSSPAITLFKVEGKDALSVVDTLLVRFRMHVDEHARDGLNAVRVSTHFYNIPAEVDRLLEALKEVAQG